VAELLAARDHQVRVQTIRLPGMASYQLEQGVQIYRTWGFRSRPDRCGPWQMAGYVVTSFLPTMRHLREFRPEVVHAHFAVPSGALALATAGFRRVPFVITAHLGDVPGGVPEQTAHLFAFLNPVIRPIWRQAAAVTAVSEHVADLAQSAYRRRATVIPNGISLNGRPPIPDRLAALPRFIFVGRFNPQKNLPFLVQVLGELKDLSWRLDFIGDGHERAKLETMVRASGLADRIQFLGWLSRTEVQQRLAQADVFLLPSTVEGLSVAALEAARAGLTIVGSDIPALRSTTETGRNGLLIRTNDRRAWIEALRKLLTSPKDLLQMRRANWRHAEAFDLKKITDQYEAVLRAAAAAPL
jgi:glycosyltransferase involved in cell wall biosynthesis